MDWLLCVLFVPVAVLGGVLGYALFELVLYVLGERRWG